MLASGALANDRRYALIDAAGRYVNGKRHAALHQVRATYQLSERQVTLSTEGKQSATFALEPDSELAAWVSDVVEVECRLTENATHGQPDDTDAPGPTLVSTASLQQVAEWFAPMEVAEVRRRMRANIEIEAAEPFWEDQLVAKHEGATGQRLMIGAHQFYAAGICQRCVVPTRNSLTGERLAGFQKTFVQQREATIPRWSPAARFDHYYRLAINTSPAQIAPEPLKVGDALALE